MGNQHEPPENAGTVGKALRTVENRSHGEQMAALWNVLCAAPQDLSWGSKLSRPMGARLLLFCARNELDPMGNDVYILGDRPYVSMEGRTKLAFRSKSFAGYRTDRRLKPEEFDEYGVMARPARGDRKKQEVAAAWLCEVMRRDCDYPFMGVGVAYVNEMGVKGAQPVAQLYPNEMAQKRARARALTLAYPIDFVPDMAVVEVQAKVIETRKELPAPESEPKTEVRTEPTETEQTSDSPYHDADDPKSMDRHALSREYAFLCATTEKKRLRNLWGDEFDIPIEKMEDDELRARVVELQSDAGEEPTPEDDPLVTD